MTLLVVGLQLLGQLCLLGQEEAPDQKTPTPPPMPQIRSEERELYKQQTKFDVTEGKAKHHTVYVVPIKGAITKPQLYILRRALKEANEYKVDTIVLDMDTPGGALDVTLDMMEALDNFNGRSVTYVNKDAISAGSFIAIATNDIYFSPKGAMGAAAVIQGTGEDLPETILQKIESYLNARVAILARESPYRAKVQRAMMDADYELKIDGKPVIYNGDPLAPKGELLTLIPETATMKVGNPPQNLLADGIAKDLDELLDLRFGKGAYTIKHFELSWSEELAKWLKGITPFLMGIGMLLLFIEFKTPGFGVFGISGLILMLIVFSSNYVAGLAGYEVMLFFVIGLVLIGVELFVVPGSLILGGAGLLCVIGSLLWSMADIWPANTEGWSLSPDLFRGPALNLLASLVISIAGFFVIARYLPKTRAYGKLVLGAPGVSSGDAEAQASSAQAEEVYLPPIGSKGVTHTKLFPEGEVEIDGYRYQAHVNYGMLERGVSIVVTDYHDYTLVVKEDEES